LSDADNPYRTPAGELIAPQTQATDLRALWFVPYAASWPYLLASVLAIYASGGPPAKLASVKLLLVVVSCAAVSCWLFAASRLRPLWLAALLTPAATLLLMLGWIVAERTVTGGISW
jgi:hypothetical protein